MEKNLSAQLQEEKKFHSYDYSKFAADCDAVA